MTEQNKKIMLYMGSYIKDRSEEKYNDHVTYDDDYNADYKSYIDLKNDQVYNIDIDKIEEFESKNIILTISVSNSYDSYLSNYMKLKKWYLEEIRNHDEEDVIEELREQYGKRLEIDEFKNKDKVLSNKPDSAN